VSWRGGALALAAVLADLAISSCAVSRRWMADEADRIDAIMGSGSGASDAGFDAEWELSEVPFAMGPAPPMAAVGVPAERLSLITPWSGPPRRPRGGRWILRQWRRSQSVGRDSAATR